MLLAAGQAAGEVGPESGELVGLRLRLGGYVVAAWLWAIIVNLLVLGDYFDVALRDFGLSLGALALARLAEAYAAASLRPTAAASRQGR